MWAFSVGNTGVRYIWTKHEVFPRDVLERNEHVISGSRSFESGVRRGITYPDNFVGKPSLVRLIRAGQVITNASVKPQLKAPLFPHPVAGRIVRELSDCFSRKINLYSVVRPYFVWEY